MISKHLKCDEYLRYDTRVKRDLYDSKETYMIPKRPIYIMMSKYLKYDEYLRYDTRVKRDLHDSKETYVSINYTKETYCLLGVSGIE